MQRPVYQPNPHKLDTRTTTADSYKQWELPAPLPAEKHQMVSSPHRFEGRTTNRDDYRAPTLSPSDNSPQRPAYQPNPHKLDSRTTTSESYRTIELPVGVQALGVSTQGGGFHTLIPHATLPPARRQAVFTTVRDNQESVSIKALARHASGELEVIGRFELGGISPAPTGLPQIVVTFDLSEELELNVSAHDRSGRGPPKQITIRDRLPTPPRERPS